MNRAQLFLTSFFLWSACAMPLLAQEQIAWLTDLRQARQIAEQQQRYVLLHFWSESCGPCRSLEQNVFNQPELIRVLTTHFVPVKINVMQQQKFAEFYKIDRVPTDIIVDTQGREISRRISPSQARDYLAMLDQARVQPTITLASNPGAGAAPPRPSSLLPPREGSEEAEPTSEPINVDPRSLHGSPPHASRWGQAGGQPAPQPTIVHNEFATAGGNTPPAGAPSESANRYDNPYVLPSAGNVSPQLAGTEAGSAPPLGGAYAPSPSGPSLTNSGTQDSGTPSAGLPNSPWSSNPPSDPARADNGRGSSPPWQPSASAPDMGNAGLAAGQPGTPGLPLQTGISSQPGLPAQPGLTTQTSAAPQPGMGSPPSGQIVPNQTAAGVAPAGPISLPPNMPPLALEGYCPVTLVNLQKWARGDVRWGAVHRGRTYLLASQADQQRFLSDPDRYSPALSGYDPVRYAEARQLVDGRREFGVFFSGAYYLFADEAALVRFESQPSGYVMIVRQAMANTGPGAQR